ncbi:DUF3253 domain-containing protein [Nisaea acidiphila]|uniref:DUF3253 domain-containing protein n=1 Tax=Nisaea acidiphila TaxID=1862145 RepID=A0A9J7AW46_9PROT|nr:DUF3253 domain-containing protein [Nisaea acidiphila]UUX49653.1 DUF3253 domain-containing protein [Nisaea acidiphila]
MDDVTLKELMLEALEKAGGSSLSPSEFGRAAGGDPSGPKPAWRALLRQIERVAIVLESEGVLVALRKGKPVPISEAKGVIRYGPPPRV